MLLFQEKILTNQAAFIARVIGICSTLGFPPDWLMIVMNFETGGTFSPSVKNPGSSATGLIQFMSSTALDLGTTTAKLAAMTNVEQLEYVYKYLVMVQRQRGSFNNLVDVYLAVFYPASIDDGLDYVYPDSIYAANKGFDLNKDGRILKSEIQEKILSTVPAQYRETIKKKIQ
jgi:hypothetical protein